TRASPPNPVLRLGTSTLDDRRVPDFGSSGAMPVFLEPEAGGGPESSTILTSLSPARGMIFSPASPATRTLLPTPDLGGGEAGPDILELLLRLPPDESVTIS